MKRTKAIFAAWGLVALMAACVQKETEKPLPEPTSEGKLNREQLLEGDSTIYGLACEGCSDSVVILLPGDGSDPVTYNIIDAHRHNRVMGRLKVGDWIGLMRNPAELVVVATDAKTGEIRYFTKEDLQKDDYRVLMASSAIPVVTRFEEVGDTFFTDGGVGEPIPIERAFEDGCDKVVLVLTTPDAPMKQKRRDKVGSVLLQRSRPQVADLLRVRHEVYNHQRMLAHELEEQGKVLIISPDDVLGIKTLTKDKERLKSLYEKGYADAEKITAFMRGARA